MTNSSLRLLRWMADYADLMGCAHTEPGVGCRAYRPGSTLTLEITEMISARSHENTRVHNKAFFRQTSKINQTHALEWETLVSTMMLQFECLAL